MKKHILHKYSNNCKYKNAEKSVKTTYETSSIEVSDEDEFFCVGHTIETRVRETSDPDEFILGTTLITETVETSDPDEFVAMGPTNSTFSSEDTDLDEFFAGCIQNYNIGDFDEILLI